MTPQPPDINGNPFYSVGRIIGTGIFSTPSSILGSVGSVGASLMLWVLGFVLSFCGLFIWLEFGTMFPRSGGEKVYLEVTYKKPRYLATVIFAVNAIVLGFTASGCIVSHRPVSMVLLLIVYSGIRKQVRSFLSFDHICTDRRFHCSILVAAGHSAEQWVVRGIALGGMF